MPVAACALILPLFGWMAKCSRPYGFRANPADHNYNLQVQGFQAGQLNMKLPVPAGFAQLADPYDPTANRVYRGPPNWLHDLSYYRGKLYLYFGATPALVLFWPWVALTGHFLPHEIAAAVFLGIGFLAGAALLVGLWRRYFPEVESAVAAAGVIALGLGAGIPITLQRPEFYEVAIACGGAFTTIALAGVWLALEQPAREGRWLAVASLAYGLAVGARPTLIVGAVILLVPAIVRWSGRAVDGSPLTPWKLLAAAVIPLVLCGLALMLYNDLRFGSPFEFGQRYQLADERVGGRRLFSPGFLWFNFRVYFTEAARWTRSFPFIRDVAGPRLPPGHDPIEHVFGVLSNMPILCLALAAPLAWRARLEPDRGVVRAIAVSAALLFATVALLLCLFFGTSWRYEMDFLPSLALLSVIGIFGLERAVVGRRSLRILARAIWGLLLVYSVAFNLLESVNRHVEQIDQFARYLLGTGRPAEAVAPFEHALRIDPLDAGTHKSLADALAKIPGKTAEAVAHYEQALQINPDYAAAYVGLGNVLGKIPGRMPEAIARYEEALEIDPSFAEAHNNLAVALSKIPGRMPDALAHYEQALRLKPDDASAHYNLAMALATMPGRMPDALAHYDQALKINPRFVEAHYNLAVELAKIPGRSPEAVHHFEKALQINPNHAKAHVGLANELAKKPGGVPEALAHYAQALRIAPDYAEAHYNLAVQLARLPGRTSEAIAQYEEALRIDPNNAEAQNNIAVAYSALGRVDEAIAHLELALKLDPGLVLARDNLRKLRAMRSP